MPGTQSIIDPERDMIVLYYHNLSGSGSLHGQFYEGAYRLFDASTAPAPAAD